MSIVSQHSKTNILMVLQDLNTQYKQSVQSNQRLVESKECESDDPLLNEIPSHSRVVMSFKQAMREANSAFQQDGVAFELKGESVTVVKLNLRNAIPSKNISLNKGKKGIAEANEVALRQFRIDQTKAFAAFEAKNT
ncbi:hypothetical protein COB21_00370 [Candidatus Aerophobetes bacterium]|uniref:Uncharacterized protein n=1 Tax=Aerophobetes bacterium TaxID=2030807 RepID=A0A2A4X948_UNCAE|nr:MAG: hypothetical protein COB21_00370 [Candidatus Aerophobetes bacterium]